MNTHVVCIGSAVLDVLLRSTAFTPTPVDGELMLCEIYGGKANVEEAVITSGGAATNCAVSFARQGFVSSIVTELGDDLPAQIIVDDLLREQVDTRHIIREPTEKTGVSAILVAADGSRSALTFRGASHMLTSSDIPYAQLTNVTHLHLSSIGSVALILEILTWAREHRVSVSWNPGKAEAEEVFLRTQLPEGKLCEMLFINDLEYAAIAPAVTKLEQIATYVVVTRGKLGGEIYVDGQKHEYHAKSVSVVDETGAGDAFASGFVGAWLQQSSLEDAIQAGVANAASVVSSMGAKEGLLRHSGK